MPTVAKVVIQKTAPQYDRVYDYLCGDLAVLPGCRVVVPFGRGNADRLAMVLEVGSGDAAGKKQIKQIIDEKPLISVEGLNLVFKLRRMTFCSFYDAVACQIPPGAGVRLQTGIFAVRGLSDEGLSAEAAALYRHLLTKKKSCDASDALAALGLEPWAPALPELLKKGFVGEEQQVKKNIADRRAVMARLLKEPPKPTEKQQRVIEFLQQMDTASVMEICYFCAVTKAVISGLEKKGVLELFEQVVVPPKAPDPVFCTPPPLVLSPAQQQAFETLLPTLQSGQTSLLYGVTGSGKTQVFLRLIEEALKNGRQALVMVPEIALTDQTIRRFTERFGDRVAVLHSSLSAKERKNQFEQVQNGRCDIVVGTRLAVFSPFANLGLIVVDEEQEHTYHSQMSPRYHAKAVALLRARWHKCPVVLCSATPSIESYYRAQKGDYKLAVLTERFSKNPLPDVRIVDMAEAEVLADAPAFSEILCREMRYNLEHGEQTILLLNRRGHSTSLRCSSCREVVKCPHCSVSMAFHSQNGRLVCHCCGFSTPKAEACPSCGSRMVRYSGLGTQQAEEQLGRLFPEARILRMDADTTMSRFAHQRGFSAFANGDYDIMIGTQMVAKGLDFPKVTLVGVLAVDQSLFTEDFRGMERTFSLITQAVGRGGRAELAGRAVIQTFSPDNNILALAKNQDYPAFFSEEIRFREVALYPPFCDLVAVGFSSENEQKAIEAAEKFADFFRKTAAQAFGNLALRVLGPAQDTPYKVANRFRTRILIKCRRTSDLMRLLWECYNKHYSEKNACQLWIDTFFE